MLEFLVCGGGGDEETFSVSGAERAGQTCTLDNHEAWIRKKRESAYPAVNLPTILVPAIVAWHMGMTSCNSASNTLNEAA